MYNTDPVSHRSLWQPQCANSTFKRLVRKMAEKATSVQCSNVEMMSSGEEEEETQLCLFRTGLQGSELHPSERCAVQHRLMKILLSHSVAPSY